MKWIKLNGKFEILESFRENELDITYIKNLCKDPYKILSKHAFCLIREIRDTKTCIFGWEPIQQFVLDEKNLIIKDGREAHVYDIDRFWERMNFYFKENDDKYEIFEDYIGYYGYLSYDLIKVLNKNITLKKNNRYPLMVLEFPRKLLCVEKENFVYIEFDKEKIDEVELKITKDNFNYVSNLVNHKTSYEKYIGDLKTIKNRIIEGDIYQVNYTQKFIIQKSDKLSPIKIFKKIMLEEELSNASFFNYSKLQIFSLSPELLVNINKGRIISKPIKGTIERGRNEKEDKENILKLQNSEKEMAELSMIVDLIRNDLNKSSLVGSVKLLNHAQLLTLKNVHHLFSEVQGRIKYGIKSSLKFLLRFIPGGSISGVPKVKAVNLMGNLEDERREIYTGNIGFLGLSGNAYMNIVIRTAFIENNIVSMNAGGGIVIDSLNQSEYIESLVKLRHMMNYFNMSFIGHLSIYNSKIIETEIIKELKFPKGVFETLLVENSIIKNLDVHMNRLKRGLKWMNESFDYNFDQRKFKELLKINLADKSYVKMKIIVWMNLNDKNYNEIIKIEELNDNRNGTDAELINLLINSKSIDPPIEIKKLGVKTLNYEIYEESTKVALENDCWDTINYDKKLNILEGGRSNIYLYIDNKWITPKNNVVNGTIREILFRKKLVSLMDISIKQLDHIKSIAVSNSLIGVRPVHKVYKDNEIVWINRNIKKCDELILKL